jgi:hypothetical protein
MIPTDTLIVASQLSPLEIIQGVRYGIQSLVSELVEYPALLYHRKQFERDIGLLARATKKWARLSLSCPA